MKDHIELLKICIAENYKNNRRCFGVVRVSFFTPNPTSLSQAFCFYSPFPLPAHIHKWHKDIKKYLSIMIKEYFLLFLYPHNSMTYGAVFPLLITPNGGYYATDYAG